MIIIINQPESVVMYLTEINRIEIDAETERQYNEIAEKFAEGFVAKIYSDGIVRDITMEQLQTYLANPDNYIKEMQNLAMYYYISNGEVFQLFDLTKVLPTLNHKIDTYDKSKNYEKNLSKCNKSLNKVKHKQLTRDIISQLISVGTITGIWLGDATNPYLYIFDDIKSFFPNYRLFGNWVVSVDLSYISTLTNKEKEIFFKNLYPYITKEIYEKYEKGTGDKIIDLPQDRSVCLRTHTLKRSQQYGLNWSTTGLFDLGHKKKLKDLEKSIANKIISAIAVLTLGNKEETDKYGYMKLNPDLRKKIYSGVKNALEKNQTQGVTVVGIPEFADIKFPEMKSDALNPDKFNSINNDITSSYGISSGLLNGTGSNFSSSKINLDVFYRRIAVILEDIENEVYSKLFKIILPKNIADDYIMVYDKEPPLSLKEKVDVLSKLNASFGFSLKAIIDCMSGVDYTEYINQSIYEQEVLKIPERIQPYSSSYTSNGQNNGRPSNDNPDNESTIKSKTNDGNKIPNK